MLIGSSLDAGHFAPSRLLRQTRTAALAANAPYSVRVVNCSQFAVSLSPPRTVFAVPGRPSSRLRMVSVRDANV